MRVSVLTITNRPGGIDVAVASLRRQTLSDFEWVLVDGLHDRRARQVADYAPDLSLLHLPDPPTHKPSNIAGALNEGLRHCQGEVVVFLQDYIWIPPHGLARMYSLGRTTLVTSVGNVAAAPPLVDPSGLITIFARPYTELPPGISWADPRKNGLRGIHPIEPVAWQINYAAMPLLAYQDIGGFNEEYDSGWAWQEVEFARRAQTAGYPLLIDMENECKSFPHDEWFPNPLKHDPAMSNARRLEAVNGY